jgi:hypothetical protein
MLDGKTVVDPNIEMDWVIDFNCPKMEEAARYVLPFQRVKETVKPFRANNSDKARREKWWLHGRTNSALRFALEGLNHYFAISQIAKYTNFRPVDISILPCEATMVVASDDFYVLGVLNSQLHRDWVKAQASTLKGDTRYTNTTCFETFPFLWDAPDKLKKPVRDIMTELDAYRMAQMQANQYGITKLYNAFFNEPASQLYKLHKQLDEAVCQVYGWKYDPDKNYNEDLFYLNQQLYEAEQATAQQSLLADKTTKPKKPRKPRKPKNAPSQ